MAKDDKDGTPPTWDYFYQYRNATSPEWSTPQRFARYDRPEVQNPTDLGTALVMARDLVTTWVDGTEMRVLQVVTAPTGPIYRVSRKGGRVSVVTL